MSNNLIKEISVSSYKNLSKYIKSMKIDYYIPPISEWAAKSRYLPSGTTEYPGLIDHSIAPHLVEIQDCFHPDSGIQQVSIMKSTQSLATTSLENVIGHSIKYKLNNILYIISSKNIAGIRSSSAIDVMIDNSNLAQYVKPISTRMKRKIADNKFYKEFHGGRRLMMTSWHSIGDAKSLTWSLIIMDEIDEAPYELAGQGDPEAIFAGRGKTIRNLKIAKISTPTNTYGRINKNFVEGDQRYYYAQCQICGELQILKIFGMGRKYGLRAKYEKKEDKKIIIPETVEYICKFCGKGNKEFQKKNMMAGGEWRATAQPINESYRSYHISNLMSPVMFYTWSRVMQEFCETDFGQKITKFKNFVIDVLGEPWETRTSQKKWSDLQERAEPYKLGTIPEGGLVITGGVDVQKTWLECVFVAWGVNMEGWIIDHIKFYGETWSRNNKVWTDLQNYLSQKKYKLNDKRGAINISIAMTGIDSGYNPKTGKLDDDNTTITTEHTVYEIVARTPRTIACRGNDNLKDTILKQEKVKKSTALKFRYDLAVSDLKEEIFTKIDLPAGSRGYIHFSQDLSVDFFKGFLSENLAETSPGKWEWKKIFERNEPLDCFNIARGAAERLNLPSWSELVWQNYRKQLFS